MKDTGSRSKETGCLGEYERYERHQGFVIGYDGNASCPGERERLMKKLRERIGLLTACALVLGMTGGTLQAAVYDATGVSGQPASEEEEAFLLPGDSVANTELVIDGEPAEPGLLDDGYTPGWTNRSGRVYEIMVMSEGSDEDSAYEEDFGYDEAGEPVYDEAGNPVYDEEGNPVYSDDVEEPAYEEPEEAYTWYDLTAVGGTVEVFGGTLTDPSDIPYDLPDEAVYTYTDAAGIPAQISAWEIDAAAYYEDTQVELTADDAEEGQQFSKWTVYTVTGNTLNQVTDEMLQSDPNLIPGLTSDMLNADPLNYTVTGTNSRILFMPVYAASDSPAEENVEDVPSEDGVEDVPDEEDQEPDVLVDHVSQEVLPAGGTDSGYQIDPETGYTIDPATGYLIDPSTGYPIEPSTGYLIDRVTGNRIDPATGQVVAPEEQEVQTNPGEENPVLIEAGGENLSPEGEEGISILNNAQEGAFDIVSSDEYGTNGEGEVQQPEAQQPEAQQPEAQQPEVQQPEAQQPDVQPQEEQNQGEALMNAQEAEEPEPTPEPTPEPAPEPTPEPAPEPAPAEHTLTLTDASTDPEGLSKAVQGTQITVRAAGKEAEGLVFSGWSAEGLTLDDDQINQPELHITMPDTDVVLTAQYQEKTETVTVLHAAFENIEASDNGDGSVSTEVKDGTTVTVIADPAPEGYQFQEWKMTAQSAAATSSMTDPVMEVTVNGSDVTLEPVYTVQEAPKPELTLTVNNGSTEVPGPYLAGQEVSITANVPEEGMRFTNWTVDQAGNGSIVDASSASTVFVMGDSNASVTANYEQLTYQLTVNSGSGGGTYHYGDEVVISADAPKKGYYFDGWTITGGSGEIADDTSAETTFTMDDSDAIVTANYELIPYELTVKNGSGSGSFTKGTVTEIAPNFPASGKEFDHWEKTSGKIKLYGANSYYTTVKMKASDATVTAVYKDGPNPNDNTITGLENGAEYLKSTTLTFTAGGAGMDNTNPNPGDYRYRPAGYQIGSVGGSWTASPYTTSMAINAVGDYTLTVSYAKDIYDGSSWNADGTSVTKSVTFHVVNALSVQTGDSSPLIPLAIAGGAALAVIIILVIVLMRRRRR